jgi:hypothetical protein
MRLKSFLTSLLLFAAVALPQWARAGETTSVHAILINASNAKAAADPKLAPYEAPLQRNLPESSFRYVAEGTASVSGTGHATLSLSRGHRIELDGEKGAGGIGLKVQWMNGNTVVMSTSLTLQPGVPAVLGRRPSGDGDTPIVLLIAK